MRVALGIALLLACLGLGACGGGGGGNDDNGGNGGGDATPENRWNQMDWNDGEWA